MSMLRIYISRYSWRIMLLSCVVLSAFCAIFFKIQSIEFHYFTLNNPFYGLTREMPLFYYCLYFVIIQLWLILLYEIYLIFVFKKTQKERAEKRDRIDNFLLPLLFSYLYKTYETDSQVEAYRLNQFRKEMADDYTKIIFVQSMCHIHNQIKGEARMRNEFIFKTIGLEKFILFFLRTPNDQNKLFALKTIADFQLQGYDKHIDRLLKSKDFVIRSGAIIARIKQNIEETLRFLVDMQIQVTEWDINQIILAVKNHQCIDYSTLVECSDSKISSLGLRLTYLHKRIEMKPVIEKLLLEQTNFISEDLFIAYATLADTKSDFDNLIYKFEIVSYKTQLQVIKTISSSTDLVMAINFLEWIIETKPILLKLEAMNNLLKLDIMVFSKYRSSENTQISNAYKQVLDLNT